MKEDVSEKPRERRYYVGELQIHSGKIFQEQDRGNEK
jgi:hypothetical protein